MGTRNKMVILNVNENVSFPITDVNNEVKRFIPCETTLEEGDTDLNDFLTRRIKLEVEEDSDGDSEIAQQFVNNGFMEEVSNSHGAFIDKTGATFTQDDGIIMLHMDIREPLTSLKYLLEEKLKANLTDYKFYLQDSQILEDHKNLVDQCVQGEGLVQVNVEINNEQNGKRINIVDVLKPAAEEYVEIGQRNGDEDEQDEDTNDTADEKDNEVMRWVVDTNFKKDQIKLNIPDDPLKWDAAQVRHWLLWAVRQFNLTGIQLSDWQMTGAELAKISAASFKTKVPNDPDSLFWTHFELLRKCNIVAVKPNSPSGGITIKQEVEDEESMSSPEKKEVLVKCKNEKVVRMAKTPKLFYMDSQPVSAGVFTSNNNGQIQLWQFLLELLTDKAHRNVIQWLDNEGEFKLINPEQVAKLWGHRKNKPHMNYEKLSRALRYYYDGDMISKVHGKRFVYKFVCDLKLLMGYSASELNALVIQAELKSKQNACFNPLHNVFPPDYISMVS